MEEDDYVYDDYDEEEEEDEYMLWLTRMNRLRRLRQAMAERADPESYFLPYIVDDGYDEDILESDEYMYRRERDRTYGRYGGE